MTLERNAVVRLRDAARDVDGDDYFSLDAFTELVEPGIVLELAEFWLGTSADGATLPDHKGEP